MSEVDEAAKTAAKNEQATDETTNQSGEKTKEVADKTTKKSKASSTKKTETKATTKSKPDAQKKAEEKPKETAQSDAPIETKTTTVRVICEGTLGHLLLTKGETTDDPQYVALLETKRGKRLVEAVK